ncbi:MAG: acyl-CoA thioesterase [Pirellulaceae bacterium]|nr:acyl-CoA thioesterase [Pirellulaceae bacterium]
MLSQHEITIRVRYQETDAQGRVHHANYLTYFELGRVELLRAAGYSYRRLEQEEQLLLVVAEATLQYFQPASYDDLLRLITRTHSAKGARLVHHYELFRDQQVLVTGQTVLACVDRQGRVRRLPDWLQLRREPETTPGGEVEDGAAD